MLMVIVASLMSVLCFALSQIKHFKAVFNKRLTDKQSTLIRGLGIGLLLVTQLMLWQQPQIGLSYVIWLCWISIWIVITGLLFSYLARR